MSVCRGYTTGDIPWRHNRWCKSFILEPTLFATHVNPFSTNYDCSHRNAEKKTPKKTIRAHRWTEDFDPIVCLWSVYLIHYYRRGIKANEIDRAINWKWWLAWVYYSIWIEFIKRIYASVSKWKRVNEPLRDLLLHRILRIKFVFFLFHFYCYKLENIIVARLI